MKKISAILAVLVVLTFVGCASSGGGSAGGSSAGGGGEGESYSVDLSTLKVYAIQQGDVLGEPTGGTVKNVEPFSKNYDDLMIVFPAFPVDVTAFQRITIKVKFFNADGGEMMSGDGMGMLSLIEDINGDLRGGSGEGTYPNIPLKQYNLGGASGTASTDRGARVRLGKAPGGLLIQNSNTNVKFIEVTGITFHN